MSETKCKYPGFCWAQVCEAKHHKPGMVYTHSTFYGVCEKCDHYTGDKPTIEDAESALNALLTPTPAGPTEPAITKESEKT